MHRFQENRPRMVGIRTAPSSDGKLLEVYVVADGADCEILGAFTPNLLAGIGVPIDVNDPSTWSAEFRVSEALLQRVASEMQKREA